MKPGFYIVERLDGRERTVIQYGECGVEWIGGDITSTVESMLKEFRVIREINMEAEQ